VAYLNELNERYSNNWRLNRRDALWSITAEKTISDQSILAGYGGPQEARPDVHYVRLFFLLVAGIEATLMRIQWRSQ